MAERSLHYRYERSRDQCPGRREFAVGDDLSPVRAQRAITSLSVGKMGHSDNVSCRVPNSCQALSRRPRSVAWILGIGGNKSFCRQRNCLRRQEEVQKAGTSFRQYAFLILASSDSPRCLVHARWRLRCPLCERVLGPGKVVLPWSRPVRQTQGAWRTVLRFGLG